jgi:hypothetical protein
MRCAVPVVRLTAAAAAAEVTRVDSDACTLVVAPRAIEPATDDQKLDDACCRARAGSVHALHWQQQLGARSVAAAGAGATLAAAALLHAMHPL